MPDPPTWAARRLDPALGGRALLAVEGRRVVGVDALARRAGARPGDALDRARGLCPTAAVVPHEAPALDAAWEGALAAAYRVTPYLEGARRGLLFLGQLNPSEAEALAHELGAAVGLARSRGTAHLAALAAAGKGRETWAVVDDARFLARAPTYLLRGAGVPGWVVERLRLLGWERLGDLTARATARQLAADFGPVAAMIWALASGLDDAPVPVHRPPDEAEASFAFDWAALEPGELAPVLEKLALEASGKLDGRVPRTLTVSVRTAFGETAARHVLHHPTGDPRTLRLAAERAMRHAAQPGLEVERLGVSLAGLHRPQPRQDHLFGALERPGVRAALDKVEARYPSSLGRMELADEHAHLRRDRWRYVPLAEVLARPTTRRAGRRRT